MTTTIEKISAYEINKNGLLYSSDKNKLDINYIYQFLTNCYWSNGRTLEQVKRSIEHSLCYGVYAQQKQVGFARVVTDYTVCASLWDVFIDEAYRGKGIGKVFMELVINSPITKNVDRWILATRDAHELYRKFGFAESATLMRLLRNPTLLKTCSTD
jgi:GNAT superfamily N-acetyltransferase